MVLPGPCGLVVGVVGIAVGASLANNSGEPQTPTVTVRVRPLDTVIEELGHSPDVIKIDVEGAELLVLRGAVKCLERHKPVLVCEMLRKWSANFDYHPNRIIEFLAGFGYECFEITEAGLKRGSIVEDSTVATNFVFFEPNRHRELRELPRGSR